MAVPRSVSVERFLAVMAKKRRPEKPADRRSQVEPYRNLSSKRGVGRSSAPSRGQGVLQIPQPVTAAVDVDHMGIVQQPVEDGGGQCLVGGHERGPSRARYCCIHYLLVW